MASARGLMSDLCSLSRGRRLDGVRRQAHQDSLNPAACHVRAQGERAQVIARGNRAAKVFGDHEDAHLIDLTRVFQQEAFSVLHLPGATIFHARACIVDFQDSENGLHNDLPSLRVSKSIQSHYIKGDTAMQLNELISKAEAIAGGTTALARRIGTPATHIHNWKSGIRACQAEDRALLAEVAGVDPIAEIAEALAERWEGKPKGERLRELFARRLQGVAKF